MRAFPIMAIAASLIASAPALAQSMANMPGMAQPTPAKKGQGTGVITAIDAKANTLTIRHGPIPAVGWPAMTMTFKASPPALLKDLRVAEKIGFDVTTYGMAAEVTGVRPQ
jgi:Cu(I)/Ag(I) efflux system protein CusF